MTKRTWTDDELVGFVWDYRVASGACTLGDLVKATGLTKPSVQERVQRLVRDGRLVRSSTSGSLRAASERLMEELEDGRLVERRAS